MARQALNITRYKLKHEICRDDSDENQWRPRVSDIRIMYDPMTETVSFSVGE